jgi:sulfate transport system permease protein
MRKRSVIPGFGLTLGVTLSYLGLMVIIPLCVLFQQASEAGWGKIVAELSSPRTLWRCTSASESRCSRLVNAVFGFVVTWVLVRYEWGRRKRRRSCLVPGARRMDPIPGPSRPSALFS